MAGKLGYLCAAFLALGLADPIDTPPGFQGQVLRELREIRQEIADVRAMLEAMRREGARASEGLGSPSMRDDLEKDKEEARKRSFARLGEIALSPAPTRQEIRKYVSKIVEASRGLPYIQSGDPQVGMLERVGAANVDVLLEISCELEEGEWGKDYILEALKHLVTQKHKGIILQALRREHRFVEIVVSRGWTQEARETLIAVLAQRPDFLPTEWISAVAGFKDLATYDDLKAYFVKGANRAWTYRAIQPLQGLNLREAVAAAWAETRQQHPLLRELLDMAVIAAEYGHLDALDALVNVLASMPQSWYGQTAYRALSHRVRYTGSAAAVVAWYRKNRDRLVFDAYSKTFGLPAEAGAKQ